MIVKEHKKIKKSRNMAIKMIQWAKILAVHLGNLSSIPKMRYGRRRDRTFVNDQGLCTHIPAWH